MPEGPEVRTVARTLSEELKGRRLGGLWQSGLKLRLPVDFAALKGHENRVLEEVASYGKMLFITSEQKTILLVQLGMTGQLVVCPDDAPVKPHTHIRWKLDNQKELRYIDPRRFGLFASCSDAERERLVKRLGPDPFSMTNGCETSLIASIKKSARPIKDVLLDQAVIAGVGNIYASEALFSANVHPARRACDVSESELRALIGHVERILKVAYENRGTTFSNYVDGAGEKGNNQNFLKVFQRCGQPCPTCSSLIERIKQGGRSTFFCAKCQK
jgi:formamidopyrimidine-DNA glycosylase